MFKLASVIENDTVNGEGVCVSVWVQGCPLRCPGCHNQELWDYNNGKYVVAEDFYIETLVNLITKNGIRRNLSILGGEPLAPWNIVGIAHLMYYAREQFPDIKIFLWTGYTIEEIKEWKSNSIATREILKYADVLITGRYIEEERDITLKWRGSRNQKILYKGKDY